MFYSFTRKMVLMKLSAGQQWRHGHREETCGHRRGRKGREGCVDRNTDTYITICRRDSQWESAVCLREPKPVSVTT